MTISCSSCDVARLSRRTLCPCYFQQAAGYCCVQFLRADVIREAEVLFGVIYKTSHVQGSRNKLVHVCNKGGVTEGKGKRLISVRAPNTKKGAYSPVMLLHVQALRAVDMCQPNVSKFVSRISHTHTHTFCVDRQTFAPVHFQIM